MCLNRGSYFQEMGMVDSADYYFNLSLASTNIELKNSVYFCLYDLYKNIGNDSMATIYADSNLYYRQLVDAQLQTDGIKHSDEKHLMELYGEALQRERNKFWMAICLILVAFIDLLGCLIWLRNRKKMQRSFTFGDLSLSLPKSLAIALEATRLEFERTSSFSILQEFLQIKNRKSKVEELENCHNELKDMLTKVLSELKAIEHSITIDDSIFLFLCYMKVPSKVLHRYLGVSARALIQRKHRLKKKLPSDFYKFFLEDYK